MKRKRAARWRFFVPGGGTGCAEAFEKQWQKNQTVKAAIRAGYSVKTTKQQAGALLKNVEVAASKPNRKNAQRLSTKEHIHVERIEQERELGTRTDRAQGEQD